MLIAALGQYFFGIAIFISSMFLVMLVLVQRGRGGGLAGALGGPGGQSAFGTKAGDLFTRITIGVAAFWIFLCVAAVLALKEKTLDTGVTRPNSSMETLGSGAAGDVGTAPANGTDLPSGSPAVPALQPPINLNPTAPVVPPGDATPGTPAATSPGSTSSADAASAPAAGENQNGIAEVSELEGASPAAEQEAASGDSTPENTLRPSQPDQP